MDNSPARFQLIACRELLDAHPGSLRIREQVEALEEAMPDRPGIAVSFCRVIIETTCKTILTDRNVQVDEKWEAPKLTAEAIKCLPIGNTDIGMVKKLRDGATSLVRGLNSIVQGVTEIRNAHGSAAHGADAYAPLLDLRYAEILARATDAVVGLMFKTHLGSSEHDPLVRFQYGEHGDFDEHVDSSCEPLLVLDTPLVASEALYRTDFQAYRLALVQFRGEQIEEPLACEPGETPA